MATPTGDDEDQDVYVAQLKEVFDSCDINSHGLLNAEELLVLCNKLQLEDQAPDLIKQLVGHMKDAKVGFEEFKEGFVAVLSEAVDEIESSGDEDEKENSSKYSTGSRHKVISPRQQATEDDENGSNNLDSDTHLNADTILKTRFVHKSSLPGNDESIIEPAQSKAFESPSHAKRDDTRNDGDAHSQDKIDPTTFEAEGQMNQSIADMESMLDPVSEEEHLKAIWKELGVGIDGYLEMEELAIVCDHIGMEEMNDEELHHLFDKLDVDGDGCVSFQEFLCGLFQHGGPNTPRTSSTPVRPLSTPRQKLRMTLAKDMEDRIHTPSIFNSVSGLFSAIDTDNSGYANPGIIIELWESLGVSQGAEILDYLQFDLNTKVNLTDLSHALEQELRDVEETNATYQAAVATYEYELRHLKTNCDQLFGEREKLKADLNEANNRISILIKEGDDRVTSLERNREKELHEIEKKHHEHLKSLQVEIDDERELLISQSVKQNQTLENEITRLKEEETKLKDRLVDSQREMEKIEQELFEIGERCEELDKQNVRQAKELNGFTSLERKLEEMETNRESILDEQVKFSEQKLLQIEGENTDLKDKNDEMTMEIEELRQLLSSNRKARKGPRDNTMAGPKRSGSVLSDYAKPDIHPKQNDSVSEGNSEDDDSSITSRKRRHLPQPPNSANYEGGTNSKIGMEEDPELESIKLNEHEEELGNLRHSFIMEKQGIEERHESEISVLRERHLQEMKILQDNSVNVDTMGDLLTTRTQEAVDKREQELEKIFTDEKKDIITKAESKEHLLMQQHIEEMEFMTEKLRQEFEEEMNDQLIQQRITFTRDLEATVSQDRSAVEYDRKLNQDIEMKRLKEDLTTLHTQELLIVKREYEEDKLQMSEQFKKELDVYRQAFRDGANGLDGEAKYNFERLLETNKQKVEEQLRSEMDQDIQNSTISERENFEKVKKQMRRDQEKERNELIKDYEKEKTTISQALTKEKLDLEKRYQKKVDDLENKLTNEREVVLSEREEMHLSLNQEKRLWEREREALRDEMEDDIAQEIQSRLEDEFLGQFDQLKEAFSDERFELESRIEILQKELDEGIPTCYAESQQQLLQKLQEENHCLQNELCLMNVDKNETMIPKEQNHLYIDKAKFDNAEEERGSLKKQLDVANEKLTDAHTQLAVVNNKLMRGVLESKEKHSSHIYASKYNELNSKLVQTERNLADLQVAMEKRATETTKLLIGSQEKHTAAEHKLEAECIELKRNLDVTSNILHDQIEKYKKQLLRSTRNDLLIKDLYVENSNLIKCLEVTEQREKHAEGKVFKLEDRCGALNRLLRKIAPAAL